MICAALIFTSIPALNANERIYPKLANYYLKTPIQSTDVPLLAKYDLLILGMQAQTVSPNQLREIRTMNPDIIMLAYVASQEVPLQRLDEVEGRTGLWHTLVAGIRSEWWLKDSRGGYVSTWPGNRSLNVTNYAPTVNGDKWNTYLAKFMAREVYSSGLWDGVFFDNVWDNASWMNDGYNDVNNDGRRDDPSVIDPAWNEGMRTLLLTARRYLGNDAIIMGNGGQSYTAYMNGRLFEGFGFPWEGGWTGSVDRYRAFLVHGNKPATTTINFNTNNTGNYTDYAHVRFGIGTTLLGDGYYAFDYGTGDHSQLLWYDEYEVNLGKSLGPPRSVRTGLYMKDAAPELYRREFENGVVFVNGSMSEQSVSLGGELEALSGTKDTSVNNGQIVRSVTLAGKSAQVFTRRLDTILDVSHVSGSYVSVLSAQTGRTVRNGFFTTYPLANAGVPIIELSGRGFGGTRAVVAENGAIALIDVNGGVWKTFHPFGESYSGDITMHKADVDGTGYQSLVMVGQGSKTKTPVAVYNFRGELRRRFSIDFDSRVAAPYMSVLDAAPGKSAWFVFGARRGSPAEILVVDASGRPAHRFAPFGTHVDSVTVAVSEKTGYGFPVLYAMPAHFPSTSVSVYSLSGIFQEFVQTDTGSHADVQLSVADIDSNGTDELLIYARSVIE